MDSLAQLQRRKAALSAKMERQRSDLKQTLVQLRKEIEPSKLLGKAISGALGFSGKDSIAGSLGKSGQLPAPIAFVLDLFVRDPKWAFLLKWVAPLLLRFWPKSSAASLPEAERPASKPLKAKFYGQLRRGVSALRGQIRKPDALPAPPSIEPEH